MPEIAIRSCRWHVEPDGAGVRATAKRSPASDVPHAGDRPNASTDGTPGAAGGRSDQEAAVAVVAGLLDQPVEIRDGHAAFAFQQDHAVAAERGDLPADGLEREAEIIRHRLAGERQ